MNWIAFMNFAIVFAFGILWGLLELMLRFNDWKYIFCRTKWRTKNNKKMDNNIVADEYERPSGYVFWYLLLNGIISVLAFYFIKKIANEEIGKIEDIEIANILIAGFSGVAVLRSSLMSISIKNKEVEIGLINVVESLMSKIDLKINHNIAAKRMCDIYEIMKDVDFDKAKDELPVLCMRYIDYFPEEDQQKLISEISSIDKEGLALDNINKSLQLGREIAKYCDIEILKRAVKKLPHIKIQNKKQGEDNDVEIKDNYESRKEKLSEKWNKE